MNVYSRVENFGNPPGYVSLQEILESKPTGNFVLYLGKVFHSSFKHFSSGWVILIDTYLVNIIDGEVIHLEDIDMQQSFGRLLQDHEKLHLSIGN